MLVFVVSFIIRYFAIEYVCANILTIHHIHIKCSEQVDKLTMFVVSDDLTVQKRVIE